MDKFILKKALDHLLTESIPQDTVNKMQDAIAASVKDFDTANYLSVLLNSDMTFARDALNTMIGGIVVGSDTVEVRYVDQNPEGTN